MPNPHKVTLLENIAHRFGELRKLAGSQSLYALGNDAAVIYIRYSKVHEPGRSFFGLRRADLKQLVGRNSFICFLLDDGSLPLFIPYTDFEEVFHLANPADDGQYKVQLYSQSEGYELYIARQGRFNVEGYIGYETLAQSLDASRLRHLPDLGHCQVQTLLAGIGRRKGYSVWVPDADVGRLDWTLAERFSLRHCIPEGFDAVRPILSEIDVIWVADGGNTIEGLFEVEHSTPIYSGLLRFNDVFLTDPKVRRFTIVSNDSRRAIFSRQVYRPTF